MLSDAQRTDGHTQSVVKSGPFTQCVNLPVPANSTASDVHSSVIHGGIYKCTSITYQNNSPVVSEGCIQQSVYSLCAQLNRTQ